MADGNGKAVITYDDYIYYFLQVLGTFAAVPDKARIVDVFRDWRLVAILHEQTTPDKNYQQNCQITHTHISNISVHHYRHVALCFGKIRHKGRF